MENFKFNQRVEIFTYGDKTMPYPFERVLIADKGDSLNDEIIRVNIYHRRRWVGSGFYNRNWIKPYKRKK
jgi:hypothetical protein